MQDSSGEKTRRKAVVLWGQVFFSCWVSGDDQYSLQPLNLYIKYEAAVCLQRISCIVLLEYHMTHTSGCGCIHLHVVAYICVDNWKIQFPEFPFPAARRCSPCEQPPSLLIERLQQQTISSRVLVNVGQRPDFSGTDFTGDVNTCDVHVGAGC